MVEPVSFLAGKARIQKVGSDQHPTSATPGGGGSEGIRKPDAPSVAPASESLSLSIAASDIPGELKSGPPIDIQTVTRIREAIAENRYPVDVEAITESLFQSFLEISR